MASMKDAMARLAVIHTACCPQEQKGDTPDMDEFTRIKKGISVSVKQCRELIKERNDILKADKASKKGVGSGTETAQLSFKIRTMLKSVKDDIALLDANVKKSEKKIKGKNKPDLQEIVDSRKEIVKLCQSHLEECENLDRERFNDKVSGDRANLFASSGSPTSAGAAPSSALKFNKFGAAAAAASGIPPPVPSSPGSANAGGPQELPDIEVAEDLALIRKRNMDIDAELNEISAGVAAIKQIAIQMGDELDKQNDMLDTIDAKVDKANEHVAKVNEKMKVALDGVMKGDKFLVNCVLLCILLALIAYIVSQLV
ncbi:hypothetical protein BC828DRAFT_371701 [Blastocladiella britannica]|nr:hypothetical protein BC828DRAFT_371701 [Blastocladiella britannica]